MMSVGRVAELSNVTAATAAKPAERVTEEKTTTLASEHTDKFIKSEATFTPAYTKATVTDNRSGNASEQKPDDKSAAAKNTDKTEFTAKSARQLKNESMKDMVSQLLTGQASSKSPSGSIQSQLNEILSSFDIEPIEADSEDFWGAEKTAQRLLDFAKNLAGDDTNAFDTLKDAFKKGFDDLVQKGFDEWEKEINAASDALTAEAES